MVRVKIQNNDVIKEKLAELVNAIANMMLEKRVPVDVAKKDAPQLLRALVSDQLWDSVGPLLWPVYEKEYKKRHRVVNSSGINKGWVARRWGRGRK